MFCIIVFETTKNKFKVWLFMKIHILQTGEVMVAPSLAYNGNTGFNPQTHGLLLKNEDRVNIPVLSFLIQTGNKNILVDTGIKRELESEEPLSLDKQLKAIKAPLTFASTHFHLKRSIFHQMILTMCFLHIWTLRMSAVSQIFLRKPKFLFQEMRQRLL